MARAQSCTASKDGDTALISEGCTHHRQCEDIGTVKMPAWIKNYTGERIFGFAFTSGTEFPEDLSEYALVIHCGGCMLNEREMQFRGRHAAQQEVPMTNYGIAIAQMHGILRRSLAPFPDVLKNWSLKIPKVKCYRKRGKWNGCYKRNTVCRCK